MILVTVGAQMAFDRLVRTVDEWAGARGRDDVFAQIGPADYVPRHARWKRMVSADEFRRLVADAEVVVAHAGMGTILTTLQAGRPLVILPRRGALAETRNDHQVATCEKLAAIPGVHVAFEDGEIPPLLDGIDELAASEPIPKWAEEGLISGIRRFLFPSAP